MSTKIMTSLPDDNEDLRKQIGCMNGIFQLFDRRYFLSGRRISRHNQKRLLLGIFQYSFFKAHGSQHQLDPQHATKSISAKDLVVQKEKPRISTESSRPSCSSSSCSSTFSSLDCNKTSQQETVSLRKVNIHESPSQFTAIKDKHPSHDIRDVVKDSMYREARGLSIKSSVNNEGRGRVMKHIDSPRPSNHIDSPRSSQQIDSPRPSQQIDSPRPSQQSTRVLVKNSKDDRLALPRFSYDGRESRESFKSGMKHKELPRLSLDSKASTLKCSPLETRLNFLRRDLQMENEKSSQVVPLNQEPGSHNRSSSVVAKLMGLEAFPDESITPTIKSCPNEDFLSKSTSTAEESRQNEGTSFQSVSQSSPKLHNATSVRKPRFPMEPAPWRQQNSSQGSPKMISHSRKSPTNTPHLSSSVYGEIEKRITDLEFKRSGKDLRALKQILEAMQKTRARLEDQRGDTDAFASQESCSDKNSNLQMCKNRKGYHQIPAMREHCPPTQLGSTVVNMKPAKMTDKVKIPIATRLPTSEISHLQRLQTRDRKSPSQSSALAKDLTPKNNNLKSPSRHLPPTIEKSTWRTSESPQRMKVESCTTSGRSHPMVSPRSQQNLRRMQGQSHPTTTSSDSGRTRKDYSRKLIEKGPRNRKVKSKDLQLSDDQLSEISSGTRGDTASVKSESNNSLVSQIETEVTSLARSINTNAREKENSVSTAGEHLPAVQIAAAMLEQPSPVSVLDDAFYSEDSPSPVKKISTAFQDESLIADEVEWHLENLNHLREHRRSDHGYKCNEKLENMKHSVHELQLLQTEPDETAANHHALAYGSLNPDQRYVNKILLTTGLLKDSSFISTTDQLLSSCHLINPDIFNVLEQTEEIMEAANGKFIEKNNSVKSNKKIQRKIIFDMVNEILVQKISSGRLFTVGKKRTNPHELLKEVYLEMDRVQGIAHSNLDDEDDETVRLLAADMMYQAEDWAEYSGEIPALVLDLERLIFKDLINEVVTGELMGLHDWPKKHCRQLFSK
ncbi:hypothetical protein BUALT_Bualt04G0135100 [Buddleja alternifolia]|uniref:DUF4378 domain-containing protein n=1 Tax=Buddleja alternifolia TaxID=168488 RepID=A0AAV6XW37_9LAMI|nr:hypothetical protein BUALT_Bualt04G0135100 [Buddleja alternifolia]